MINPDQIEEMTIEQLKANFSLLMGIVVKQYGDDQQEEEADDEAEEEANAAK